MDRYSDHTAQKDYNCDWCNEEIPTGRNYIRRTGIFRGDFYSDTHHPECWEALIRESKHYHPGEEMIAGTRSRGKTWEESRKKMAGRRG